MLNEKQIFYLLTLAEEHNITAAARKLYISQPALSRLLSDLEDSLGTQLFIRSWDGLYLTQAGEIYLKGCRDALTISNSVHKQIQDLSAGNHGSITLGLTSLTGEFIFPYLLDHFEQQFPHIELILKESTMNDLQNMVRVGKVDMAFVYQSDDPELTYIPAIDNPVFIQCPPSFIEKNCFIQIIC